MGSSHVAKEERQEGRDKERSVKRKSCRTKRKESNSSHLFLYWLYEWTDFYTLTAYTKRNKNFVLEIWGEMNNGSCHKQRNLKQALQNTLKRFWSLIMCSKLCILETLFVFKNAIEVICIVLRTLFHSSSSTYVQKLKSFQHQFWEQQQHRQFKFRWVRLGKRATVSLSDHK